MEKIYLQWNLPNWITVLLMSGLGYMLLATITKMMKGKTDAT